MRVICTGIPGGRGVPRLRERASASASAIEEQRNNDDAGHRYASYDSASDGSPVRGGGPGRILSIYSGDRKTRKKEQGY